MFVCPPSDARDRVRIRAWPLHLYNEGYTASVACRPAADRSGGDLLGGCGTLSARRRGHGPARAVTAARRAAGRARRTASEGGGARRAGPQPLTRSPRRRGACCRLDDRHRPRSGEYQGRPLIAAAGHGGPVAADTDAAQAGVACTAGLDEVAPQPVRHVARWRSRPGQGQEGQPPRRCSTSLDSVLGTISGCTRRADTWPSASGDRPGRGAPDLGGGGRATQSGRAAPPHPAGRRAGKRRP